ncbi:MAG TPA: hypothetical protein VFV68_09660, partial [Agriterribacter sp.]|nr:hypothetical protein [Agriterribacter sp.]
SWGKYGDRYSNAPETITDSMIVYEDDYFKKHTWLWDGKPHWAYKAGYMSRVQDRKSIEWTPNTIASKVTIKGNEARIELNSNTPNLQFYQMKELPGGTWENISNTLKIELKKDRNETVFRTMNLAGVTGPEHRIIIER